MTTEYTLHDLHDAFAELEHRADLAEMDRRANLADPTDLPKRRPRIVRSTPVFATVAAVAALIVGAVWVVPSDFAGTRVGTAVSTSPPTTPAELETRFRAVLGDTATFEVSDADIVPDEASNGANWPDGLLISGPLTANGVAGWYELTIFPNRPCREGMVTCGTPDGDDDIYITGNVDLDDGDPSTVRMVATGAHRMSTDGHTELRLLVGHDVHSMEGKPIEPLPLNEKEMRDIIGSPLWW